VFVEALERVAGRLERRSLHAADAGELQAWARFREARSDGLQQRAVGVAGERSVRSRTRSRVA
jgi:hypothetical protein